MGKNWIERVHGSFPNNGRGAGGGGGGGAGGGGRGGGGGRSLNQRKQLQHQPTFKPKTGK